MAYISAKNGFDDPKSSYQNTVDENGKHHIEGTYFLNGVGFHFSLNEQARGYLLRGRISVRSPANGKVLKMIGGARRVVTERWNQTNPDTRMEGKALEKLNIFCELNINAMDELSIKARISKSAAKLYAKHEPAIRAAQKELGVSANRTAAEAAGIHMKGFLKSSYSHVTAGTRRSVELAVKRAAAGLSAAAMGQITPAMIKNFMNGNEKSSETDLRYAQKFWDFCRVQGVYQEENPITAYLQASAVKKLKKSPDDAMHKAAVFTCLPEKVQQKLNDRIRQNLGDSASMGFLLVMESGLPAQDACGLLWKDVIFREDWGFVSLHMENGDSAGATHDYTRPIFPFGAEMLSKHHRCLLEIYTEEQLLNLPLITPESSGKKPVSSKELTAFCRAELFRAGMAQDDILPIPGEPYGMGISLLLRNYRHRLEHDCGLISDPSAVNYLAGHSLQYDVTADHYRSFTCPEGQQYLYNAMKRDTRFCAADNSEEPVRMTQRQLPDGRVEWTFTPTRPGEILCGDLTLTLHPDEEVYLSATQGLSVRIEAQTIE